MRERQKDPTQLPVQLNVTVPWQLREDLYVIADRKRTSMTKLVKDAIVKGLRSELSELMVEKTRNEGATS